MATLTSEECRARAVALLTAAQGYTANTPARQDRLAEAQVYATLALSAPVAPVTYMLGATPDDALIGQPAPTKRRTRKTPPAKPADEVVPGSEEDLIRQEGAK